MADEQQPVMERKAKEPETARKALVTEIIERIEKAEDHWEKTAFKQMREDQSYAHGKQHVDDEGKPTGTGGYVANLTLRRINNRVAALYAKNPRAKAKRRPRMDFKVWDGKKQSLAAAQSVMQAAGAASMGGMPGMPAPSPEQVKRAQLLLQDVQAGHQRRNMLDKIGKTLEILFHYSLDEPIPRFKTQAKQLVRRALTCKVGFVELGYQRIFEPNVNAMAKLKDCTERLERIERIAADMADGEVMPEEAEAEELRIMIAQLQQEQTLLAREGLVFDFPKPWHIIPDTEMTQLKGFVGAGWVARKYIYHPDKVKELFSVDLGSDYTGHTKTGEADKRKKGENTYACIYRYYDLQARVMYTVCDGYPDFLVEPGQPDIDIEQFHPFFTLTFNDVEDDEDPYPPSDVEQMRSMQDEYNRSREGKRQHRIANRPAYVARKGSMEKEDKDKFAGHASQEILEINMRDGETVEKVLQAKPSIPIEESLYDNEYLFGDIMRVSGDSEPNFGGTSGATATESTIAENSRASGLQSNVDDLDELFTEIARAAGQVLLKEMDQKTAAKIAGEGAVWPSLSREEIAEEIYLDVQAGSSGRPNRALKVANIEKIMPYLMQIPDINPRWMLEQLVTEIDETIDLADAVLEGMPSMTAMNSMQKPGTGDAMTDPNQQGAKGGNNAPQPQQSQAGGRQLSVAAPQQQTTV